MSSLREQIVTAIETALNSIDAPDVTGVVPITRRSNLALGESRRYALVIDWTGEDVEELSFFHDHCALQVEIAALVRMGGVGINDAPGAAAPESAADTIITAAHLALMADRTLGGLSLGIRAVRGGKEISADGEVKCAITHSYVVTYRRKSGDLAATYP